MRTPNTPALTDVGPTRGDGERRSAVVVIPTYNEADNIVSVVDRTLRSVPDADVLIVDDNSPDGTGEIADALAREHPEVHVLHRASKDGLGAAYLAGFRWAIERSYPAVAEMDADGSHQPEQLPELLEQLDHADLVLGSRWVAGGRVENWPRTREWLSRGGNAYIRRVLRMPLHDTTGGFRVFRRNTLETVGLGDVESRGYCFQVDLAQRVVGSGLRAVEVPIVFRDRERGTSKMTPGIAAEALWRVTRWALQRRQVTVAA